jgi:hypothetical protein
VNGNFAWDSLESEFAHYAALFEWRSFFEVLHRKNRKQVFTMSELVTLIEGMGLALLVKGEVYKFISTVFGKSSDEVSSILSNEVKCFNAQRTAETFLKSYKMLKEAGVEPQKVQLKTLISLLDGISLEENEELQERWTNLLTAAIAVGRIHPSYPVILGQISSLDAKILDKLYELELSRKYYKVSEPWILFELADEFEKGSTFRSLYTKPGVAISKQDVEEIKEMTSTIEEGIDNLVRQKLVEVEAERINNKTFPTGWGYQVIKLSSSGKRFLKTIRELSA